MERVLHTLVSWFSKFPVAIPSTGDPLNILCKSCDGQEFYYRTEFLWLKVVFLWKICGVSHAWLENRVEMLILTRNPKSYFRGNNKSIMTNYNIANNNGNNRNSSNNGNRKNSSNYIVIMIYNNNNHSKNGSKIITSTDTNLNKTNDRVNDGNNYSISIHSS